jgi:hypothetical protein
MSAPGFAELQRDSGIDKVVDCAATWQLPAPDFRTGVQHNSVVLFSYMLNMPALKNKIIW